VSASSSRLSWLLSGVLLAGCIGPWDGSPQDGAPEIRAAVAVFVQPGRYGAATFSRPLDNPGEFGLTIPWIDFRNTQLTLDEGGRISAGGPLVSRSYPFDVDAYELNSSSTVETSLGTFNPMDSFKTDRTWRFHGHLRWNASSPLSVAQPLWVTDSVDAWGEFSTTPGFVRTAGALGPLELRWKTLAWAYPKTRSKWSTDPDSLSKLAGQWAALQTARGREARVLVLDTTSRPMVWRWADLDTTLLRKVLAQNTANSTPLRTVLATFSAGDTIWTPSDHGTWIQAAISGTQGMDIYFAHQQTEWTQDARILADYSLATTTTQDWPGTGIGATLLPHPPDSLSWIFTLGSNSAYAGYGLELAVAGTCPSQRIWFHQGASSRTQLPHGNVGPLDGFVCEMHADTMRFPFGQ
jgi:hypothetical protein